MDSEGYFPRLCTVTVKRPKRKRVCGSYSHASYTGFYKILFKKLIINSEQKDEDHDQGQSVGQITAHPVVDF